MQRCALQGDSDCSTGHAETEARKLALGNRTVCGNDSPTETAADWRPSLGSSQTLTPDTTALEALITESKDGKDKTWTAPGPEMLAEPTTKRPQSHPEDIYFDGIQTRLRQGKTDTTPNPCEG